MICRIHSENDSGNIAVILFHGNFTATDKTATEKSVDFDSIMTDDKPLVLPV